MEKTYKFQKKKTYYKQETYEFNLPAGHSCPFANDCKIKVDRITGKFNNLSKKYRCYAASSERFPGVRESRWKNYDYVLKNKDIEIPKNATHIRIHSSGDFFSQDYFDMWLEICRENPKVKFWAFTKSIQFWINRINKIPNNLTLQASYGSLQDELISKHNLKYAKVFSDYDQFIKSKLPLDTNDSLAQEGEKSFALLDNTKKFIRISTIN